MMPEIHKPLYLSQNHSVTITIECRTVENGNFWMSTSNLFDISVRRSKGRLPKNSKLSEIGQISLDPPPPSLPNSDIFNSDIEKSKLTPSLLTLIVTFSAEKIGTYRGSKVCVKAIQSHK